MGALSRCGCHLGPGLVGDLLVGPGRERWSGFDGAAFRCRQRSPEEAARAGSETGSPFCPEHFDAPLKRSNAGPALLIFFARADTNPRNGPFRAPATARPSSRPENAEEVEAARAGNCAPRVRGEPADLVEIGCAAQSLAGGSVQNIHSSSHAIRTRSNILGR